jgi:hypothetical protein
VTKPKLDKRLSCSVCGNLFERTGHRGGGRAKECSLPCRFKAKIKVSPRGCHEWTAGIFKATGYGQFAVTSTQPEVAHRVAWVLANGEIPGGLWVLHKCDNRLCSNPEHLFLGTQTDNMQDMAKKGRHVGNRGKRMSDEVRLAKSEMMKRVWEERRVQAST